MYKHEKYRVCLVNPPVLGVLEPWYDTPDFGRTGLAYLAAYLRQHTSFEVQIIDAKFERLDFNALTQRVLTFEPHLVGFTAFTNEIKPAAYAASLLKQLLPHTKFVIGGTHVTAIPSETITEFPVFDFGVVGEGEVTLLELCTHLLHHQNAIGQSLENIQGLIYKTGERLIKTNARERILDQDTIPFPAWDLLPPAKTYYIQSIRGCPLNCIFCMNPNGKVPRKRSVENVMEEIRWILGTFKPERISFGDELFSVDMERTHLLLKAMAAEEIGDKVRWDVQTHVQYVNKPLFQDFKLAKVERVELGIETGDEELLRKMGKGTTVDRIFKACNAAKEVGVPIGSFFLIGQPNETVDSINRTIQLAVKINPDLPMFGLMTPYPGTEVSRMAANGEGGYQLLSTDWDEYNKQIGGALAFAGLTRKKIEWLQIKAYLQVYLLNRRYIDLIRFIFSYKEAAWELAKKVLFNRTSIVKNRIKPEGYDAYFKNNGTPVSATSFKTANREWVMYQKNEQQRINNQIFASKKLAEG